MFVLGTPVISQIWARRLPVTFSVRYLSSEMFLTELNEWPEIASIALLRLENWGSKLDKQVLQTFS
jgi:hypothetical protein